MARRADHSSGALATAPRGKVAQALNAPLTSSDKKISERRDDTGDTQRVGRVFPLAV